MSDRTSSQKRPRSPRDPVVIEVVERLPRGCDSDGKIKEAAHLCAKPLAGLAFRRAVEEGGELL